jgi:hypothetical protein
VAIDQNDAMGDKVRLGAAVLLAVASSACAGDDDSADLGTLPATVATVATTAAAAPAPAPTTAPETTVAPATSPATAPPTTEPPGPQWTVAPVEGCVCSDGSPLNIFERVADPTKVVLYFEGGGACFNATTCDPNGSPTYTVNRNALTVRSLATLGGYFDAGNPENPLADHSIVYVPYCTGDVHEGSITKDYGNGVVIEHRGSANAAKALDHLVSQYPDAQQVVVTGESAGSVPTALYGALVADRLPNAGVVTFGDSSGAYPDVDPINAVIGEVWGFPGGVPDWPELDGLTVEQWSFPEQYIYAGHHAPRVRFGRFDHAFDQVQAQYGALAGVPANELVTLIDANEQQIEEAGVAVATYVAPGNLHTVVSTDDFYGIEVEGVRLVDWVTALINDPEPPADVHCVDCE